MKILTAEGSPRDRPRAIAGPIRLSYGSRHVWSDERPARAPPFLVRHGETLYGGRSEGALPGEDLTDEGYRQIESLAELLRDVSLDGIYSSPLGRAQATARTLAKHRNVPIVTVPELQEITPGDFSGQDMAAVFTAVRTFFVNPATDWDTPYLGGETYRALRERVWPFLEGLVRNPEWQRVAIVAHGGVNNALLGRILGCLGPGLINLEQDFGCLNVIDLVGDRPVLRLANFTAYDPVKAQMEGSSMEILRRVLESGLQVRIDVPDTD